MRHPLAAAGMLVLLFVPRAAAENDGVLAFTADGKHILTSSPDSGELRLWDSTGKSKDANSTVETSLLAAIGRSWPLLCDANHVQMDDDYHFRFRFTPLKGLTGFVGCSADGKRVLTLSKGTRTLVVHDRRLGKVRREIHCKEGDKFSAAISPDGKTVAVASWKNLMRFFDVDSTTERLHKFAPPDGSPTSPYLCVKFSPDGSRLAVADIQGLIRILSVADGRVLAAIREYDTTIGGTGPFVTSIAFAPDGRTLTVRKGMGVFTTREIATGQVVHQYLAESVLYSPDGHSVAIMGGRRRVGNRLMKGQLFLQDFFSGRIIKDCEAPSELAGSFAFAPDSRQLAGLCRDGSVVSWSVDSAKSDKALDDDQLDQLWHDIARPATIATRDVEAGGQIRMGNGKSAAAYQAIGRLIADPERAMPFLRSRLEIGPPADSARVQQLISDLAGVEFAKRKAATEELARLGLVAGPALRVAHAAANDLEARRRLERLLGDIRRRLDSPSHFRSVQVLEAIGTKDARSLLQVIADASLDGCAAREARDALRRMRQASIISANAMIEGSYLVGHGDAGGDEILKRLDDVECLMFLLASCSRRIVTIPGWWPPESMTFVIEIQAHRLE